MNRSRVVAIAAAAALLPLGLSVPAVAAPGADASPTGAETIMFDGFCDGMTINLPSLGTGQAGTLDGVQTGCDSNPIFGTAAPKGTQYGVSVGREFITIAAYGVYTIIRNDNTFSHYVTTDGHMQNILDGTWSLGTPGDDAQGAQSSIAAALSAPATPGLDAKGPEVLEVSFDGTCDGISLTNPSEGNGEKRSVEGASIGCSAGYLFIGSKGKTQGVAQSYSMSGDIDGNYIQVAVLRNHTWLMYTLDGDKIVMFNSGTWTEGPPPASAADLPSALR